MRWDWGCSYPPRNAPTGFLAGSEVFAPSRRLPEVEKREMRGARVDVVVLEAWRRGRAGIRVIMAGEASWQSNWRIAMVIGLEEKQEEEWLEAVKWQCPGRA